MPSESLFINCRKCGKGIRKTELVCKHCGAKRSPLSAIHLLGIAFFGLIIFGIFTTPKTSDLSTSSPTQSSQPSQARSEPEDPKVYEEGETVHVGYMSYAVWGSRWASRLSENQYLHEAPDAMYLVVELTVRNNDSEARTIPSFDLVDERGAKYESSSKAWAVENTIGVLDSLNPGVDKSGLVVFDVPQERKYRLKASGGFWSKEDAFIELSPDQRGVR